MTEPHTPFRELAEALRDRIAVVGDRDWYQRDPAGHLERLKSGSERISTLGKELPEPVDPRLSHFLERCSYDKALAFLEAM